MTILLISTTAVKQEPCYTVKSHSDREYVIILYLYRANKW